MAIPPIFRSTENLTRVLLAVCLLILVTTIAGQGDVKICPAEPQWTDACPNQCSSCDNGVCVIENKFGKPITCPEGMPCRIMCFPTPLFAAGCENTVILCPKNASCDLRCLGGACRNAFLGCASGSAHSCTARCDSESSISSAQCDNSTACNCDIKCNQTQPCIPGFSCYGDPCFVISGACSPYDSLFSRKELFFDTEANYCTCRCKDPTDHLVTIDGGIACVPDAEYCETDAECHGGRCERYRCKCDGVRFRGAFCNDTCSCNLPGPDNHVAACDFTNDSCFCETGWGGQFCNISTPLPQHCSVAAFEEYNILHTPPVAAPVDAPVDAPADAPLDSPAEAPVDSPLSDAPLDPPADNIPPESPPADAPVAAPQAAPVVPFSGPEPFMCPLGCSYCEGEVCVVRSISLIVLSLITAECPPGNFTCRIVCDEYDQCAFINKCGGDRPCEFFCVGRKCEASVFYCSSTVSCRTGCDSVGAPLLGGVGAIRVFRDPAISPYSNASRENNCPIVDNSQCYDQAACFEGSSCHPDDPCSSKLCNFGRSAYYNKVSKTCECFCGQGFIRETQATGASCRRVFQGTPCARPCRNGGVCFKGECICITGFTGESCEQVVTSNAAAQLALAGVARNIDSDCPLACSYCENGTCVISIAIMLGYPDLVPIQCPDGWACMFVCDSENCAMDIVCEGTSGPCTLVCLNRRVDRLSAVLALLLDTSRAMTFRYMNAGSCSATSFTCNTAATGYPCGVNCANADGATDQLWNATCLGDTFSPSKDGNNLTSPSRCWMRDTCTLIHNDPCWQKTAVGQVLRATCPIATNGFVLQPRPTTNSTGHYVCECFCGEGFVPEYFQTSTGQTDVRCSPASGCNPPCQNAGVCIYSDSSMNSTRCDCFSGYSGRACQTRCFFPVSATITSCENGIYIIAGSVNVNQSIDILKDTERLVELIVNGNMTISGQSNLTLSLLSANGSLTSAPNINITGQFVQNSNTTIMTEIAILPGGSTPTATTIYVFDQATLSGNITLSLFNATSIRSFLESQTNSTTVIDLFVSGSVSTTMQDGSGLNVDLPDEDPCSPTRFVATTRLTSTRLSVVLTLEANPNANSPECKKPADGVNVAAAVVGILIPVLVVAAIVTVFVVPSLRARVFPFMSRPQKGNDPALIPMEHLESGESEPSNSTQQRWTRTSPSAS